EIFPGTAIGTVVLAYRAPLPLGEVGSPLLPALAGRELLGESPAFGGLDGKDAGDVARTGLVAWFHRICWHCHSPDTRQAGVYVEWAQAGVRCGSSTST